MRKLFWFLYERIRLWYLYRGNIPLFSNEGYGNSKCPNCYWDRESVDYDSHYLGSSDCHWGYEGSYNWTEKWKCPRCGQIFEIDESN